MKKILFGFIFTILMVNILYFSFNPRSVKAATTITVPDDYATIQEAVDAASSGDTIFVKAGTYYGGVELTERNNLSLKGENRETIVDGNETTLDLFDINGCTNIRISGFTIRNGLRNGLWIRSSVEGDDSDNITVENNNIQNCSKGIMVGESHVTTLSFKINNNSIITNGKGIFLDSCGPGIITENILSSNGDGIYVSKSIVEIEDNDIYESSNSGIEVYASIGLTSYKIGDNRICGNTKGIIFHGEIPEEILGIGTVYGNVFETNDHGIFLHGTTLEGWVPHNCTFYHNNFVNNTIQVTFDNAQFSYIKWNSSYPTGGNYWSDYNGSDLDNDGIGDSPYQVGTNNTDYLPLITMAFGFRATPEYRIQTICNSTITGFSYNGSTINFEATGEEGTTGFCQITIPTALMNETYRIFINGTEISHTKLPISNSMYSYLYFTFDHSTKEITIVPEFSALNVLLPLFLLTALLAALLHRRKNNKV